MLRKVIVVTSAETTVSLCQTLFNLKNPEQPTERKCAREVRIIFNEKESKPLFQGTCDGGIFTFEKTTAHFLRTGRETPLELSTNTPGITSGKNQSEKSIVIT